MAKFRTAMGKVIDMSALASRNEKTRAVGNMDVNARGDIIDGQGRIIKPVTAKVSNNYSKTVTNRSAQANTRQQPRQQNTPQKPDIDLSQLTEVERELEESFDDDLEIEKIKAQELKKK
jgi:hypothetical protein